MSSEEKTKAIGIFDSGVGGLTVLKEIEKVLPHESIIYFGDTARVPYGTKSAQTIERYCLENATLLLEKNIKVLIIACNTASAFGMENLKRVFPTPIIGVINPGAHSLAAATKNKKVAVLATKATITSEVYPKAIHLIDPEIEVISIACPLLVPMIEEQMLDHAATRMMVRQYLLPVVQKGCDSILLGCTHYPLIKAMIEEELVGAAVIDSAQACALEAVHLLNSLDLNNHERRAGERVQFYVSDDPLKFKETGERFLEKPITNVFLKLSS